MTDGNTLRGFSRVFSALRGQTMQPADFVPDAYSAPVDAPRDTLQSSPAIDRRNMQNLHFALNAVSDADMADILEAYLTARFGKMRASFIGRDIARIAETGK